MGKPVTERSCNIRHEGLKEIIDLHMQKIETRLAGMDEALRVRSQLWTTIIGVVFLVVNIIIYFFGKR